MESTLRGSTDCNEFFSGEQIQNFNMRIVLLKSSTSPIHDPFKGGTVQPSSSVTKIPCTHVPILPVESV